MSTRILITGLAGFVGRHLAAEFQTRFPETTLLAMPCDITDRAAVDQAVAVLRPDLCLHLAAIAANGIARNAPDRAWAVNLHGTLALAATLQVHVPECKLFFVSSADAYGRSFQAARPLDETAALAPLNTYSATKAAADLALGAMAADGLHVVRLRAFNHVGPGQSPDFALAAFARQIALIEAGRQEPILRTGNLTPSRDFLDVRDVVRAYALALQHAETLESGVILNIASGISRRIGDVLDRMLVLSGVKADVLPDTTRRRAVEMPFAAGNAVAARKRLGWTPAIPFDQTLADILADWRQRV